MTKRRINISIGLMLLAIVAIVAFQSYWLHKNFREEERNLTFHTNVLFHEAMQRLRAEKLKIDSNIEIHYRAKYSAVGALRVVAEDVVRDSLIRTRRGNRGYFVGKKLDVKFADSLPRIFMKDSMHTVRFMKGPDGGAAFIQVLRGVEESLQDSITAEDLSLKYAQLLKEEKINVPFRIIRTAAPLHEDILRPAEPGPRNEIIIGISKPVSFRLLLENTTWFNIRKMSSQIAVSLLLVGLTIFSFILLLRNLMQQRKLTLLKNDFISNITHELKTPIATVNVAIEALRNFNALEDPQRTKEYLDISANELQRLSLLVDKVLKLSMFEKRQIELREETVDLKQLVEEVAGSMKLQFEKYKALVNISSTGSNFTIKADRLHVTSVIFNLLDNALKYSKAHPSIQVAMKETPAGIELHITDNGIGIAPEFKRKIFDKFFRIPTGDTHNVKGYGLGLSYVAYVIQRHKGTIDMESQPGIGSRFIIKLFRTA